MTTTERSKERERRAAEMIDKGYDTAAIAAMLGVGRRRVAALLRRAGYEYDGPSLTWQRRNAKGEP